MIIANGLLFENRVILERIPAYVAVQPGIILT